MERRLSRILISAVLLMLASGSIADISARDRNEFRFWQGSELRLTWGAVPFDAVTLNHGIDKDYGLYGYGTIAGGIADSRYYGGDGYLSGAVGLTYTYRFRKWFELSGVVTYSGYYRDYFDKYTGNLAFKSNDNQISVMPYVRFVWVHTNLVRLYSGIGLGVSFLTETWNHSTSMTLLPAFALTPIGITVGTYVYGIAEVSLGNTGTFSLGIGYKF